MNRKLDSTTGRLVRRELRTLADGGLIRDARVRVDRIGRCCRCRISSHAMDGSPIMVESVAATRTRAVELAVQRLHDRVRPLSASCHPFRKDHEDDHDLEDRARPYVGWLPHRGHGLRFVDIEGGWALQPRGSFGPG